MPREFVIPSTAKVVFVADMFAEDYVGGAELTTEAIYQGSPVKTFKLHSDSLTEDMVVKNRDKYWILTNWSGCHMEGLVALVANKCRFSVVEYDYKYCKFRSSHLHKLQTNGEECKCEQEKHGRFVSAFYRHAEHVFFMSSGQKNEYVRLFPELGKHNGLHVQSSVFTAEDLHFLDQHRIFRFVDGPEHMDHPDTWVVLKGGTWIKNQEATEQYCKTKGIPYDLVGGLPYKDFLKTLREYKGLVFHPAGFDTCPRLVIEAKLLGLELDLNDNVQHKDEEWFTGDPDYVQGYLRGANERFWSKITL